MKNEVVDAPITFEEFVIVLIDRLKISMLSRISEQSLPELLSLNLQVLPLQRNARTTGGFLFKHEVSNNCVSQVECSQREEFKIEKFHLPVPSYTALTILLLHFHFLVSLDPVTDQICLFFPFCCSYELFL